MTLFYPIYVRRSDGQAATTSRGKREEPNRPTEEQMDQRPDANGVSDFYREVPSDEAKHVDWRRKLGGMLARELQRKDAGKSLDQHFPRLSAHHARCRAHPGVISGALQIV